MGGQPLYLEPRLGPQWLSERTMKPWLNRSPGLDRPLDVAVSTTALHYLDQAWSSAHDGRVPTA